MTDLPPRPQLPPIERHRLDNGLRVNLVRDARLPLVAINLWYHVGSKDERPGRTGLAHLFEHMLFQGSLHVGTNDHFRYVQEAGGVANGSTWYDRTNYYETLPSSHLELGLWLESDRMGFLLPALTPAKLENQRSVVMNERRQRVDNQPYGRANERLHELLYPPDHPYHWPVIGTMEDIEAASMDDVRSFFETHYAPSNAVLTLAGDLDLAAARRAVDRYFGDLPPGPQPARATPSGPPPDGGGRRDTLHDNVQLPRLYRAWSVPPYGSRAWHAVDLLTTALAGGRASRLYHRLVYREELAQEVSAFVFPTELAATAMLVATPRPGIALETLEEAIDTELADLAAAGATRSETDRSRSLVLTSYFEDLQALDQIADVISQGTTFFDDPGALSRDVATYLELTGQDLGEVAADWLQPTRAVTVSVLPREVNR